VAAPAQAWYAVSVFAVVLMLNFLDRGILTLLVEPIKKDLALSDQQIGLLIGFAFVVFYALLACHRAAGGLEEPASDHRHRRGDMESRDCDVRARAHLRPTIPGTRRCGRG